MDNLYALKLTDYHDGEDILVFLNQIVAFRKNDSSCTEVYTTCPDKALILVRDSVDSIVNRITIAMGS